MNNATPGRADAIDGAAPGETRRPSTGIPGRILVVDDYAINRMQEVEYLQ